METELDAQQQLIAQKDNNIINLRQQTEVVDGINRELAESSTSEAERTTALEHALSAETQKCENLESLITTLRVNEVSLSVSLEPFSCLFDANICAISGNDVNRIQDSSCSA